MPAIFKYDVFLSHSSQDKSTVRYLAEQLKRDGLRVWFDEWEVQPGDSISLKIEQGLEQSRMLILCMSRQSFAAEWATLERHTALFRDPANSERRFIPLRLDDAEIKDTLKQFAYIDWRDRSQEEYERLLAACRLVESQSLPNLAEFNTNRNRLISLGHTDSVWSVALSGDGRLAITGSADKTVRVWEVESGRCLKVLEGHTASVLGVALSGDGQLALSGSADKTVRVWEVESGRCLKVLEGHINRVWGVALSGDGGLALSGSYDKTVRVWEVESGRCLGVLAGHTDEVNSVALSGDGRFALSGSDDRTMRVWEVESGRCLKVLEGHTDSVLGVALSGDGRLAISGSAGKTVRVWDVESGRCLKVLEGHTDIVEVVVLSGDGRLAISGSADNTMRVWEVESGRCLKVLEGHTDRVLGVAMSGNGRLALSGSSDRTVRTWKVESGRCLKVFEGHTGEVNSVALSGDGRFALSGSDDRTMRVWKVESGRCLKVLEGHTARVWSVALSGDGRFALSGSDDRTVRVWEVESGRCLKIFEGHTAGVLGVALSGDGRFALSGSADNTMRVWEVESGRCLKVLEGHTDRVLGVALSGDGRFALSGSYDNTIRVWEVESGRCLKVLEGHTARVLGVALSGDGQLALSGSADKTVRVWEVESGRCLKVLEGHTNSVWGVALSDDGRLAATGSSDRTVRVWEVESGRCLKVLEGHTNSVLGVAQSRDGRLALSVAFNGVAHLWSLLEVEEAAASTPRQDAGYANAKVVLVGESGAGKTGLSRRLALNDWQPSDSTVGAWATQWKLPVSSDDGVEREIWLWDFGGQADQRLIHQLYLDETALAVLVFDGQKEDLFETLGQWDRDLTRATHNPFTKLLVAGRVDAGGLRVSRSEVEAFAKERGYLRFLETSAKANQGCKELEDAIFGGIQWESIPWRSSPLLFKRLKDEIISLKDEGAVLMRFNELRDTLRLRLPGEAARFTDDELRAVVSLLAGPGVVWELKFGSWVLLRPELINAYAQAVIQTMRSDEHELGCLPEARVLKGDLTYYSSMKRLGPDEEQFVLLAMHQTLVERGLCLREHTENGPLLIFPNFYRRERPDLEGHPAVLVSYRFSGFLYDIYATLVVRLHHTKPFERDHLWRYAADFKTLTGRQLGVKLTRCSEGAGELAVYFDPAISMEEKIIFSKYVHEHLLRSARDVTRLRHYVCPHCGILVGNPEVAMKKLQEGKKDVPCINCDDPAKRVPLWDQMEELFAGPEMKERVRDLQEQSAIVLDNESKERVLVGEVISTVALAGHLCRELNTSDHGIDMEIEFKSDAGEATGQKVYLQLKSGDSYLSKPRRDGAEIFRIRDERHARYWMAQAFPVLLVIRNSEGKVRWMEVRDWLKRESDNGKKAVKQIIFEGEPFTVTSLRKMRDGLTHQRSSS